MKNKTLGVVAIILLVILAVSLYLFSIKTIPLPELGEEPQVEEEAVKGTIYLSAKLIEDETGKSAIQITAMPEGETPFLLSAFSIKGVVISDSGGLSTVEEVFILTPGEELNNWVFWDKTAYSDTKGGVVVELNGYHQSEELYTLEGEVVLATIPLDTNPVQQVFTFELDSEFTEFFGEDAKEEFMIKAK
jgi:hypothetical protein